MASAGAANAQMSFQQSMDNYGVAAKCVNETTGEVVMDSVWRAHRVSPIIADFNNNGWMDVYYGGASCVNGWRTRGVLLQNLGNRQWEMFLKPAYETYTYTETVMNPDTGEPELDADGNPIEVEKEGVREVTGLMDNGLPKSAYLMGSIPVDINADGMVDMVLANRAGNDTGMNGGIHIVKNLGNMQFRWMNHYDQELDALLNKYAQGEKINEGCSSSIISAADYDKDGYVDLLVEFYQYGDNGGRRTMLLHNIRGERFEPVNVFKPLPFDQEVNKRGVYTKSEETMDEFGTIEPGSYTDEPTMKMHQMSNGHVFLVDFDGDTWPDILVSGWMDGEGAADNGNGEEQKGGWNIRFYRNCQDGTFEDKTMEVVANFKDNTGLISEDQWDFEFFRSNYGKDDVIIVPMDWNQDGMMDLLFLGSVEIQNGWKSSLVWYNYSNEDEGLVFEQENFKDRFVPTTGLVERIHQFMDINGDDEMDLFITSGWMNNLEAETPSGDWFYGLMLSDGQGGSTLQSNSDAGYWSVEDGSAMGDLDNDGKLDIMSIGWGSEGDQVTINWNTTEGLVVETPDVPENLSAEAGKGTITMTWDAVRSSQTGSLLAYNVYCKNTETGEIRMMAPANLETGKQLAYPPFYNYLVRGEEPVYSFENLPKGSYEVGVQAVAYSYQSSAFSTTTIDVVDGATSVAKAVVPAMTLTVTVNGDNLVASSNETTAVSVFNAQGAQVATGMTNEAINVKGHGVFVVKAGNKIAKVVK